MIRHTVACRLKHPPASEPERAFLRDAKVLISIPTVRHFECLRLVETRWKPEVVDFMALDYVPFEPV